MRGRDSQATVRAAKPEDYPALTEIYNLCWPLIPEESDDLLKEDSHVYEHAKQKRFVAELDGKIVATGRYYQIPARHHPEKFWLEVEVHPEFRGRGIGSTMFEAISHEALALGGRLLRFSIPSEREESLEFLRHRGYSEEWRAFEVRLDLRELSAEKLKAEAAAVFEKAGATLCTLREAKERGILEGVYEVVEITRQDTAFNDQVTPWGFENFERTMHAQVDIDRGFVALIDGKPVGTSYLLKWVTDGIGDQGWTGVHPEHRRKGLARALKLLTIAAAIDKGCTALATNSHSQNTPMRTLNDELGFREVFAWIYMSRDYGTTIRDAKLDDLEAICELRSHTMTEPLSADMMRIRIENFDPEWHWSRWVACDKGEVVACGQVYYWDGLGDRNFYLNLDVDPRWKKRGVGARLLKMIEAKAREVGAKSLTGVTRGDRPHDQAFAEKRGFAMIQRLAEGLLDMSELNVAGIEDGIRRVNEHGLRIATFAEIGDTEENRRKLHGIHNETDADTPGQESWGEMPYEVFEVECFKNPKYDPHGIFVALDGDKWAGISMVCEVSDEEYGTVYTGIRRDYRGKGAGLALKGVATLYARSKGAIRMRAQNDLRNKAMLAINTKIGFRPQFEWVYFRKTFEDK